MVDGETTEKVRLVVTGFQDPFLHPSHPRLIRSLDFANVFLQVDVSKREVYVHAPLEWEPLNPNRGWRLRGVLRVESCTCGNLFFALRVYVGCSGKGAMHGPRFQVSFFDPRSYYIVRRRMATLRGRSRSTLRVAWDSENGASSLNCRTSLKVGTGLRRLKKRPMSA